MNLDQEEPIERKVAEIAEGGNDCRILPASSGRKITGLKDGNKLWNRIILPHDKIGQFYFCTLSGGSIQGMDKRC